MADPTRRAVKITQGPDGDPQVELGDYVDSPPADNDTDTDGDFIGLTTGEDKISVKHTYCYVAGNQTQYTSVGVELVAQPGDDAGTLFERAVTIATNGAMLAADALTESITERRNAAKN